MANMDLLDNFLSLKLEQTSIPLKDNGKGEK